MKNSLLIASLLFHITVKGQDTTKTILYPTPLMSYDPNKPVSIDQNPGFAFFMPILRKKTYGELRFNYDASNTAGLFLGRIWSWKKRQTEHTFIPQGGLLLGEFMGFSIQLDYNISRKRIDFNLQNFYDFSINGKENFYFNWSSAQFGLWKGFAVGISSQTNLSTSNKKIDGGYFVGYQHGNWGLRIFHFNVYLPTAQYFYLGIQIKV